MRRVTTTTLATGLAMSLAGLSLAGCSSFSWFSSSTPSSSSKSSTSTSYDPFAPPPLVVEFQIDSVPQGAEARLSLGPSCRTPCAIPLDNPLIGFSVTYTLNGYLPLTVPVQVARVPAGFWNWGGAVVDPNPVVVELQPVPPPPPPPRRRVQPKKPALPKTAAAPPAGSPFPAPPPTR